MTTAPPATIDWIRFTIDGSNLTLSPSPDFELRLTVVHGERDDFEGPARFGPSDYSVAVDLVPLRARDFAAVDRCEERARDVAAWLGTKKVTRRDFTLEAGLGGEGLPYNRMEVARLQLVSIESPTFDEDEQVPAVRVFTARMLADGAGTAYVMRLVD